jgi:hypothetical protein
MFDREPRKVRRAIHSCNQPGHGTSPAPSQGQGSLVSVTGGVALLLKAPNVSSATTT